MADISIEELGPGVILEGTNPDKERYRYSIPVRKGTVVYVHPKGRFIVAKCGGVRETFFPEEVLT